MLADRFEAFLTVDQNIEFQQNVKASGVAVIVVVARTNRLRELRPLGPKILDALKRVKAGDIMSRRLVHRLNGRDEQRRSKLRH